MEFFGLIKTLGYIHWFSAGIILLVLEIVLMSTFLLWLGGAATICGLLTYFFGFSYELQITSFTILSSIGLFMAWKIKLRSNDNTDQSEKGGNLINHSFKISKSMISNDKLEIDGTLWAYESEKIIKVGDKITISGIKGNKLII